MKMRHRYHPAPVKYLDLMRVTGASDNYERAWPKPHAQAQPPEPQQIANKVAKG
jgi:hypothetical protein